MGGAKSVRCSAYIATSVDGCIARDDGGLDWLDCAQRAGEDYGHADFFASVDALLIGRATYDVARGFSPWPYAGKRVFVLTHRPLEPAHGEVAIAGTAREVVERLEREGVAHAYVDGGTVIRQLLAADLLDELTLSIVPVVLGGGIRLFDRDAGEHALELVSARSFPSGLVQIRYRATRGAS